MLGGKVVSCETFNARYYAIRDYSISYTQKEIDTVLLMSQLYVQQNGETFY